MIFNELSYALLLLPSVLIFYLVPIRWRPYWLVIMGTAFYAYYARVFLLLIAVEIAFVWLLTREIQRKRWMFLGALGVTLGALGYFKYRNMLSLTAAGLANLVGWHYEPLVGQLVLPLAISFFTFEFVHYVVDCRKGLIAPHTLIDFLAFAMFFPTMVAGPIKRFQDFTPRVGQARLSADNFSTGITRILVGLFRKMVVADSLDYWSRHLNTNSEVQIMSSLSLWIAIFAYSIKIYMDFAGYSDIAIGSARLLGIKVPENFLQPYFQHNIANFWKCWHVTLYRWIVDYVFIPLGGSRTALRRTLLNTLIAMSASGLWHGAAWNFVLWGCYHGVLLCLYRLFRLSKLTFVPRRPLARQAAAGVSIAFTFFLVTLGWLLFVMPMDRVAIVVPKLFWRW